MKPPVEEEEIHHRHAAHGSGFKKGTRRDRVVISTVVIGVGLFLFVGMPYLKHNLLTGDAVLNSIGNGEAPVTRNSERDAPAIREHDREAPATRDPDREAVRAWLRANTNDRHPQEIRWWASHELIQLHQQRLRAAREAAAEDPSWNEQVLAIEKETPDRVCRLKYRIRNEAGDDVTRDDLFTLRDGKAHYMSRNSSLAQTALRFFADDQGVR
jgi:hypothetical protein